MYRVISTAAALAMLTACGPVVDNTDKPAGVYIGEAVPVAAGAKLVSRAPSGGTQVSGISCKNKIWNPEPTKEVAVSVMQREAADAGFNSVHLVSVKPVDAPILLNCWSAIRATGVAFNQ